MKPVFKFLLATGVCVAANVSYAGSHNWMANPYLGLEYKLGYTKAQNSWKRLLPTNKAHNSGTAFVGLKFHDCLAGEFGYTRSTKNTKSSDVSGFSMFGSTASAGTLQEIKLNYRSWNIDVNGQYPAGDCFAFLGTLGLASTKPKFKITNLGTTGAAINDNIKTITGKTKVVPRIGVGVQYTQGMFGVRSRILWEGTSKLRVNTGTAKDIYPAITDKAFKSTYAWTVGAFVRW